MKKKTTFSIAGKRCVFAAVVSCFLLCSCKSDDLQEYTPQMFSIGGTVTKSDGGAASGASVRLMKISDGSHAGESPANAAGQYIITGLIAESYKIIAALAGYETASMNEIKVSNADITLSEIILQKITAPTYSISGTVTKSDGNAAEGASVQIYQSSDNTVAGQAVTTDASGDYLLSEIPAGEYNLIITFDGHEAGVLAVTVNNANITEQNIALQTITVNANAIGIVYSDKDATISNLPSDGSITVSKSGADVTIASSSTSFVEYVVSGSTTGGSLKIQNNVTAPNSLRLTLNSAVIVSASKLPPIQITKNEGITIVELKGNNILSDNASNEENATLISKSGSLELEGYGKLTVSGSAKHAIGSSKKSITVRGGDITVTSAASDGFHADDGFEISGGSLNITASGDGIDAGIGTAVLNGGNIRINSSVNDTKGIKADAGITVGGGRIEMNVSGARSKGIGSKEDIVINGGAISIVTSGATVLEAAGSGYDPSYCTAIKSDKNITVAGGTIQIESLRTADGGKGLSADGDIVIRGGTLNISTAGDGKAYTTTAGSPDSYSANCIRSNRNISLLGGNITCSSSGTGGKGINADGEITIGVAGANNANLVLTVGTSGDRFSVSGNSSSGQGGRPGGGGFGDDGTDYANPKAVKSEGNMTINSGNIRIKTEKNGGEGLESKDTLTVNGGRIEIEAYDDPINAANNITFNGGEVYCYSIAHDGIDSNGTITITGGVIITSGVSQPEGGFDCDNKTFTITGGIAIGIGGTTSIPTASVSTQLSVAWGASGFTAGQLIYIKSSDNSEVLTFKYPRAYTGNMSLLFTSPLLKANTTYTLYKGGTVSGGSYFNGLYTGAGSSGGTLAATFTTSSMVTSVGNVSTSPTPGGGGGQGRPW